MSRQRRLFCKWPKLRALLLVAGIIAIIGWQGTFRNAANELDDQYTIENSFGGQMSDLVFFYHYLGLFPLKALENPKPEASRSAAAEALKQRGHELQLADPYDRLTLLSYLPDVYLGGDPYAPHHTTAAWLGFIIALSALYTALWTARLELFGITLVMLTGSDPFQLHEVYVHDNVFGWAINIGLISTAINIPLIVNHRYFLTRGGIWSIYLWLAPILTGMLLGVFRHLRTECLTTMIAALGAYTLLSGVSKYRKAALIAIVLVTYVASNKTVEAYFDHLDRKTVSVVSANGGTIGGARGIQEFHLFWHPFWGGLGDFDGKYGYLFWDRVITDYAAPIVAEAPASDPGVHIRIRQTYADALRDKIVSDAINDPLWYATIIAKRINKALTENTPPRLAVGSHWLEIPGLPQFLVPFCVLALVSYLLRREWSMLRLMMFPFAIGGVSIAITSINGYHYYMLLHIFLYALLFSWVMEALLRIPFTLKTRNHFA